MCSQGLNWCDIQRLHSHTCHIHVHHLSCCQGKRAFEQNKRLSFSSKPASSTGLMLMQSSGSSRGPLKTYSRMHVYTHSYMTSHFIMSLPLWQELSQSEKQHEYVDYANLQSTEWKYSVSSLQKYISSHSKLLT